VDNWRAELKWLWQIAWPLLIAQTAQMGTGIVDSMMAGHYSDQVLAAIAIGFNIWLPLYLLVLGTMLGTASVIAQNFGAKRFQAIRDQLPQTLWLAVFLSLVVMPLCFASGPLLRWLSIEPTTAALAEAYVEMVALGFPAIGIFMTLRYHTQGVGITKPFAWAAGIGFLTNIPLNYALIYGEWGAPELGAVGCGIATAVSMWISTLIICVYVIGSRKLTPYLPPWRVVWPNIPAQSQLLRIGIPVGLTFTLEMGVFSVIALFVATLGDTAMAAHQIAFNVWDTFYIPMLAVSTAMATRIGHFIGSRDQLGIRRALTIGLVMSAMLAAVMTSIMLLFPRAIVSLYTDSSEVADLTVRLVALAALFIVVDALQIVMTFIVRAYKDMQFPFWVTTLCYWLLALPLGYWLGLVRADNPSDGVAGFWYGIIAGISLCAVLLVRRVRTLMQRPFTD
jgi:MATE family multidrug resistance protein